MDGIAIAGTDEHDRMGVYIEPPAHVVGTDGAAQHYVFRTQPEGARSGPGDTDLVSYSPHKRGDVSDIGDVLAEIADVRARVEDLLETGRTPLPDEPDRQAISAWAVSAHRRHWGW